MSALLNDADLVERIFAHIDGKSTDKGTTVWREPAENYSSPIPSWHVVIGDPTYADAIMDRFIHNAHRIELTGESMRRTKTKQPKSA